MEEKEERKKAILKEVMEYVRMIIFVVIFVFVVNNVILINAKIPSESMEQTIMTNDRIFGFRLAYKFADPERYDIVIFKYPDDPEQKELFIKRVIGLPGETVEIREGKVYIDGAEKPLRDDFCPEDPLGISGRIQCRRSPISCWGITGIIPRIPGSGRSNMCVRTRS